MVVRWGQRSSARPKVLCCTRAPTSAVPLTKGGAPPKAVQSLSDIPPETSSRSGAPSFVGPARCGRGDWDACSEPKSPALLSANISGLISPGKENRNSNCRGNATFCKNPWHARVIHDRGPRCTRRGEGDHSSLIGG
eukprot:scaffold240797_cov35-Tisochrysis_lutea.AAC.3